MASRSSALALRRSVPSSSSPRAALVLARTRPSPAPAAIPALGRQPSARTFSATSRALRDGQGFGRERLPMNTGVVFAPQQEAWVVERFGRFLRILQPGLNFLIPVVDRIAYRLSLKETATEIERQQAITSDNVSLGIDGVLYTRVIDPYKAAYNIEAPLYAVSQLAQTTMRAEIGQLTLDRTLSERTNLNFQISEAINSASKEWGVSVLRYEIKDIQAPHRVVEAMHQQVSAERQKRATILASEALQTEQINIATGQARALTLAADAQAEAIETVARAIESKGGKEAVSLRVAEKYVDAFKALAKEGNSVIIPAELNNMPGMIGQAMSMWKTISQGQATAQGASQSAGEGETRSEGDSAGSAAGQYEERYKALMDQATQQARR